MSRKNNLNPATKKKFTSEYQPTPEAKSIGKKKKQLFRQIAQLSLSGDTATCEILKRVSEFFGIEPNEIDVETLAHLVQIEKAIVQADTKAYIAVMDRLRGRPPQSVKIEAPQTPIKGIRFESEMDRIRELEKELEIWKEKAKENV